MPRTRDRLSKRIRKRLPGHRTLQRLLTNYEEFSVTADVSPTPSAPRPCKPLPYTPKEFIERRIPRWRRVVHLLEVLVNQRGSVSLKCAVSKHLSAYRPLRDMADVSARIVKLMSEEERERFHHATVLATGTMPRHVVLLLDALQEATEPEDEDDEDSDCDDNDDEEVPPRWAEQREES